MKTGATAHHSVNHVRYFIKTSAGGLPYLLLTVIRLHLLSLHFQFTLHIRMACVNVKMVGRWPLWKLETERPAQGHLHIKYFKTFYWSNKAGWVCSLSNTGQQLKVGSEQGQTTHGYHVSQNLPSRWCA